MVANGLHRESLKLILLQSSVKIGFKSWKCPLFTLVFNFVPFSWNQSLIQVRLNPLLSFSSDIKIKFSFSNWKDISKTMATLTLLLSSFSTRVSLVLVTEAAIYSLSRTPERKLTVNRFSLYVKVISFDVLLVALTYAILNHTFIFLVHSIEIFRYFLKFTTLLLLIVF